MRLSRLRSEGGAALITVMLLIVVIIGFGLIAIQTGFHANDSTVVDRKSEEAFQAADAGFNEALRCLSGINSMAQLPTCETELAYDAGNPGKTQLVAGGHLVGTYDVTLEDVTFPPGSPVSVVRISSLGYGPKPGGRAKRFIVAEVKLLPGGGFSDTVFAGGLPPASGGVDAIYNTSVIGGGTIYARGNLNVLTNAFPFPAMRAGGNLTTDINQQYTSVWVGGNILLNTNVHITAFAKACGDPSAPGNVTVNNNVDITGNLQYKGTLLPSPLPPSVNIGSTTHAGCTAPPDTALPTFTSSPVPIYQAAGWTVRTFSTVALANTCLSARTDAACGGLGAGMGGGGAGPIEPKRLIYVNPAGACGAAAVQFPSGSNNVMVKGDFGIVTKCKLKLDYNLKLTASPPTAPVTLVFVSTSSTGTDDLWTYQNVNFSSANMSTLLYTTGQMHNTYNLTLGGGGGAIYGGKIYLESNSNITYSPFLANNPPPGFTFSGGGTGGSLPVVELWQERAPP